MAQIINVEDHNRAELDKLAQDAGLADASKYPNKPAVADAINRVRSGEDAATVNAELAPQAGSKDHPGDIASDGKLPARRPQSVFEKSRRVCVIIAPG